MAVVLRKEVDNGLLVLWRLTESVAELEDLLTLSDVNRAVYERISGDRRKQEWLAWHAAVMEVTGKEALYDAERRPILKDSEMYISVTHSGDYVAVRVSDRACGVDIESITRSVAKVESRILDSDERGVLDAGCILRCGRICEVSLLAWCAKEAVFKYAGRAGVDFLKDMKIKAADDKQIIVQLFENEFVACRYDFFSTYVLIWC